MGDYVRMRMRSVHPMYTMYVRLQLGRYTYTTHDDTIPSCLVIQLQPDYHEFMLY